MKDTGDSQQSQLRRTTIVMTVLAAVFVVLRLISRVKKGLRPGYDDYGIVIALVRSLVKEYIFSSGDKPVTITRQLFLFADAGFNLARMSPALISDGNSFYAKPGSHSLWNGIAC